MEIIWDVNMGLMPNVSFLYQFYKFLQSKGELELDVTYIYYLAANSVSVNWIWLLDVQKIYIDWMLKVNSAMNLDGTMLFGWARLRIGSEYSDFSTKSN